jgi:hypothetical protein
LRMLCSTLWAATKWCLVPKSNMVSHTKSINEVSTSIDVSTNTISEFRSYHKTLKDLLVLRWNWSSIMHSSWHKSTKSSFIMLKHSKR